MTAAAGPVGPRAALLEARQVIVRGVLDDRRGLRFVPEAGASGDRLAAIASAGRACVSWAGPLARHELDVAVVECDLGRNEVTLRPVGAVERVQRRRAVRTRVELRCTLLTADAGTVTVSPGRTIDLSAGGAAIVVERDADIGGTMTAPRVGSSVGLVLQLPDRRVAAVAEVLEVGRRAGRTTARLELTQVRASDATALTGFVLRSQARRTR